MSSLLRIYALSLMIGAGSMARANFPPAPVFPPPQPAPGSVSYNNVLPAFQISAQAVQGDFNHDGRLDIATLVAGQTGALNTISIQLGNGDGTFSAGSSVSLSVTITALAAADVNGDGLPDLVVTSAETRQMLVVLNAGAGKFTPLAPMAVPEVDATQYASLHVLDFNKDGAADILMGTSLLWYGNGKGTFQGSFTILPDNPNGQALVGDFNGDGYIDVAVTYPYSPQVAVYLNSGLGVFSQFGNAFIIPANFQPALFAVGDFNSDGKADLAMVNAQTSQIQILLSTTSGSFNALAPFYASAPGTITGVQVADLDGDGRPDLLLLDQEVSVLFGRGNGTFESRTDFYETINFSAGQNSTSQAPLTLGDFNSDGRLDLLAYLDGQTQLLLSAAASPIFVITNPVPSGFGSLGQTTIGWNSPGSNAVQVVVGSPTGPALNGVSGSSGSAITGHWVTDGTVFYLVDVTNAKVLGSAVAHVVTGLSPIQLPASINATPIVIASGSLGVSTISWSADASRYPSVSVVVGTPSGPSLTGPTTPSGTAQTGVWAPDGMQFFLIDVATGSVIGSTTASVAPTASLPTYLNASPNPATGNTSGLAQVTLSWETSKSSQVAIAVGSPGGPIFTAGGREGSATTGFWVTNGTQFFLQDVSGGKPLTAANTLASITVAVTP